MRAVFDATQWRQSIEQRGCITQKNNRPSFYPFLELNVNDMKLCFKPDRMQVPLPIDLPFTAFDVKARKLEPVVVVPYMATQIGLSDFQCELLGLALANFYAASAVMAVQAQYEASASTSAACAYLGMYSNAVDLLEQVIEAQQNTHKLLPALCMFMKTNLRFLQSNVLAAQVAFTPDVWNAFFKEVMTSITQGRNVVSPTFEACQNGSFKITLIDPEYVLCEEVTS